MAHLALGLAAVICETVENRVSTIRKQGTHGADCQGNLTCS